jgi:hypothetical protein
VASETLLVRPKPGQTSWGLFRKLFETVVARCLKEGIVGGEALAVDASMIEADAHRRRSVAKVEDLDPTSSRAVAEYLSVLDDAAFGWATPVEPKAISPTDPAARYTAAADTPAVCRAHFSLAGRRRGRRHCYRRTATPPNSASVRWRNVFTRASAPPPPARIEANSSRRVARSLTVPLR